MHCKIERDNYQVPVPKTVRVPRNKKSTNNNNEKKQ